MHVIKVGGNELDNGDFLAGLARFVAQSGEATVIVHGGGKAIAEMEARLGLPTHKVDGLRVTSAAGRDVVQMVLSGHTNKLLVQALLEAGVDAVGLSGVDGKLLQCVQKHHPTADLGYVGEVVAVRTAVLEILLAQGMVPVVSPVSRHVETGEIYNVNADDAAVAVARALGADRLSFVSNVPGVLDEKKQRIPQLTAVTAEALIAQGVINGGMIPKVRAALAALGPTLPQAVIVDLAGLAGGGTIFNLEKELV